MKFLKITAGILAIAALTLGFVRIASGSSVLFPYQGGTGTSTAPSSGQVLIGNASSTYSPANVSAGPGISITASSGGLSIGNTGILSLNGLTTSTQTFATGTTGTDFGISSSGSVHTFNLPTASASNRGLLSSTDWSAFNGKQNALTLPLSIANGGTGISTAPSATGQFLLASSTSWVVGSLVAGSNITISTSTPGLITLSATGGAPAGTSTDVQYNTNGSFDATSTFTFSATSSVLTVGAPAVASSSVTFSYTGATTTWVVPSGTTEVHVSAYGAAGNLGNNTAAIYKPYGGSVSGYLNVTPGTTYYIGVGGQGVSSSGAASGGAGGFGGGGAGATGSTQAGNGGGGMTWLGTSSSFSTSTAVFVAAGGGGSAGNGSGGNVYGGQGGYPAGSAGENNSTFTGGGGGGTQTAGGTGGTGGSDGSGSGNTGTAGTGGAAGNNSGGYGGGGGGGGYYGGGGGQSGVANIGGSGGGGSDFFSSAVFSTSTATSTVYGNGGLSIVYENPAKVIINAHIDTGGSIPSVSACGTSPSVVGNDSAGTITTGSGTVTSCQLNFEYLFSSAPVCTFSDSTTTGADIQAVSDAAVTFGFGASLPSGQIYYHCFHAGT